MSYLDVRGPDGRLLFKYDPDRLLVEIRVRGVDLVVDLTQYQPTSPTPAVVNFDPLSTLSMGNLGVANEESSMLY